MLQLLDKTLIDETSAKAKESPRLRMNYNFHPSLEDKVQRFINCMESVDSTGSQTEAKLNVMPDAKNSLTKNNQYFIAFCDELRASLRSILSSGKLAIIKK